MDIWTLYDSPENHERRWVVRLWNMDTPTGTTFESDSRQECEAFVREQYPSAFWMPRSAPDDPCIVGTWI